MSEKVIKQTGLQLEALRKLLDGSVPGWGAVQGARRSLATVAEGMASVQSEFKGAILSSPPPTIPPIPAMPAEIQSAAKKIIAPAAPATPSKDEEDENPSWMVALRDELLAQFDPPADKRNGSSPR